MNETLSNITTGFEQVTADVRNAFGGLSAEQLNWKPRPDSWSVGQCLDHLIKSNDAFKPAFAKFIAGDKKPTFWEKYSPLTGFFGNFLLKSLKNDARKFKAPSKDIVPPSDIPADIVEQFAKQQAEIVESVKALDHIDWNKTVVTSPFLKLMTYRLDMALECGLEHTRRHFRQAQRVTETEGFPKRSEAESV